MLWTNPASPPHANEARRTMEPPLRLGPSGRRAAFTAVTVVSCSPRSPRPPDNQLRNGNEGGVPWPSQWLCVRLGLTVTPPGSTLTHLRQAGDGGGAVPPERFSGPWYMCTNRYVQHEQGVLWSHGSSCASHVNRDSEIRPGPETWHKMPTFWILVTSFI